MSLAGRRRTVSFVVGVALASTGLACSPDGETTPTTSPTTAPAPTAPATTAQGTTTTSPFGTTFAYQPLWPFRSLDDAEAWQQEYRSDGGEPWHLDADQTALRFATGYLGFTEMDRTTSHGTSDVGVLVGVGYESEGGRNATAAVIHLLRLGSGTDAPWEVVGTDDTSFTLSTPAYGAKVSSPLTVGGEITGFDEAITAYVRQVSSDQPLGEVCCGSGSGEQRPWELTVEFAGATDPVLTVVAATGGHIKRVERFTVTAVRA